VKSEFTGRQVRSVDLWRRWRIDWQQPDSRDRTFKLTPGKLPADSRMVLANFCFMQKLDVTLLPSSEPD
jgi:hypothetical protein